ncbi:MAG: substrate-binding domain-containing protein, partial [Gammaproteobacteria bacterium]|nr:substrate-binding domain-containing protein [Gammaproteobacteria bacterium]
MNIFPGFSLSLLVAALVSSSALAAEDVVGCKTNCSKTITWTGCEISKLGFMVELADTYGRENGIKFALTGGGATKGIREVVSGDVHLGGLCRLPMSARNSFTADEKKGVELEKSSLLIPMGWDALVVIVHKDNPVSNVSITELTKILKGEITDWEGLRGNNGKKGAFNLYVRQGKI